MISIRTNVDSLNAQSNLNTNRVFQSNTIQQLTTGYRINNSGDDAAGLAVANGFRSSIAELTQGVSNGNDGVSQLQIVDGGLSNISMILNRMKTLASQSASGTFTGSRATLNQEYQQLTSEITRQAGNINLNTGGSLNTLLKVYVGGANNSTSGNVAVDLSGSANAVDATSLGLSTTNVLGGGVGISGNTARVDATGATFVQGTAGTNDQSFTFNVYSNGASTALTVNIAASAGGTSLSNILGQFKSALNQYGITAQTDNNGQLQFTGATAFTVSTGAPTSTNDVVNSAGSSKNTSNYTIDGQTTYAAAAQTLTFQTSSGSASVSILAGDNMAAAISKINAQTASMGVYAVANTAGTGISLQGSNSFSVNASAAGTMAAAGNASSIAPTTGTSNNGQAAITAINNAIQSLGLVQGRVGSGENKLHYAISLAQSQISSFSAAESQIRDADIAAAAANLTKSQVLQQTSIAAMAQANSEPQSILKLLQ